VFFFPAGFKTAHVIIGLYEPHLVDITMPSGHVWKWDTSGTVWGFFRNLSTGFHISGDEVKYVQSMRQMASLFTQQINGFFT